MLTDVGRISNQLVEVINRVADSSTAKIEKDWRQPVKPALGKRRLAQADVIRGLWGSQHSLRLSHCSTIRCTGIAQPIRRNIVNPLK